MYISARFSGDQDLKELFEKNLSLNVLLHCFFSNKNIESGQCELSLNSLSLKEIR